MIGQITVGDEDALQFHLQHLEQGIQYNAYLGQYAQRIVLQDSIINLDAAKKQYEEWKNSPQPDQSEQEAQHFSVAESRSDSPKYASVSNYFLVDTVPQKHWQPFRRGIIAQLQAFGEQNLGGDNAFEKIKYLVIQHAEQNACGCVMEIIKETSQNVVIICTRKCYEHLSLIFGQQFEQYDNILIVNQNTVLDLTNSQLQSDDQFNQSLSALKRRNLIQEDLQTTQVLRFIPCPLLLWPDQMMTTFSAGGQNSSPLRTVLFSSDMFSQLPGSGDSFRLRQLYFVNHFSRDPLQCKNFICNKILPLFEADKPEDSVNQDTQKSPCASTSEPSSSSSESPAQERLLGTSNLSRIYPAYGNPTKDKCESQEITKAYVDWASFLLNPQAEKPRVLIIYESLWGATSGAAAALYEHFVKDGISVSIHDVRNSTIQDLALAAFSCTHVFIGSPSLNSGAMPGIVETLSYLAGLRLLQNKPAVVFGSFGWGIGEGQEWLKACAERSGCKDIKIQRWRFSWTEEELDGFFGVADNVIRTYGQQVV